MVTDVQYDWRYIVHDDSTSFIYSRPLISLPYLYPKMEFVSIVDEKNNGSPFHELIILNGTTPDFTGIQPQLG